MCSMRDKLVSESLASAIIVYGPSFNRYIINRKKVLGVDTVIDKLVWIAQIILQSISSSEVGETDPKWLN